ncbi:oligosaccharide flippase family protein [Streptococcus oricebi]|uniref:Polysaccharide biosynthesis protein n=1 Tax=Streptococcus oricebi TaxID=1547447 RepID=A0ABS5B539_9STRE|nr:oligosaccharide flippase family protein [Streptococcus oricebi]MBP2623962.1 hypothetical protein [Streptococcus oricebi]
MSEKASVKRAGLGYVIGNYFIRGIGFLTLPIFSRLMSTEDFGIYNTYLSYETILFVFVGLALHTSYKNAFVKFENSFNEYVSNTILLSIINTLFFLVLGLLVSWIYPKLTLIYMVLLVIHAFATAIITDYNSYVSLYFKSGSYVKMSSANAIGNILLSLILILTVFKGDRSMGRIVGTVLPTLIIALILIFHFFKSRRPTLKREHTRFALNYSIPLIPHGISQVILSSVDRIMIANMVGNAEAGIYSFAYTIYSLVAVTFSSLDQVWAPWFYRQYKKGDKTLIRLRASQYAWAMGIFTALIILVSPEIILIVGSETYRESSYIVIPIVIGGYFSFLYTLPAIIEYYFEKTKYIAGSTLLAALVNIALNYFCIISFGYQAAAYTTLVTYALYFILHYYISYRISQRQSLYDTKQLLLIIAFLVLIGLLAQIFLENLLVRILLLAVLTLISCFYLWRKFKVPIMEKIHRKSKDD